MPRKTIEVEQVREWANTALKSDSLRLEDSTPEQAFRLGVASFLEQILHNTGNYHGYTFVGYDYVTGSGDETRRNYK